MASLHRYIITRDFERPDGVKGRQCWTGKTWVQDIEQVKVFHDYVQARVVKRYLDFAVKRDLRLRIPGLKIMQCDIRQLLFTDFPDR